MHNVPGYAKWGPLEGHSTTAETFDVTAHLPRESKYL